MSEGVMIKNWYFDDELMPDEVEALPAGGTDGKVWRVVLVDWSTQGPDSWEGTVERVEGDTAYVYSDKLSGELEAE